MKYIQRLQEVEAIQWFNDESWRPFGENKVNAKYTSWPNQDGVYCVLTPGVWIVKKESGYMYLLSDEEFKLSFVKINTP